jgi:CHAP domain
VGTAAQMLAEARRSLGTRGRPNYITTDYAKRHGSGFLRAAWCDMAVTYWARASGNTKAVLPGGDRAYTVYHAQDFQKAGRWHKGTAAEVNKAEPGDIVFFDWGATDSVGAIDHVGVVEKALGGGRVQTIEGNTGDQCLRRVRAAGVIAGYGRPAYAGEGSKEEETLKTIVDLGSLRAETVPAGERRSLDWEIEYLDPDKVHTDAEGGTSYPSIFPKGGDAPHVVTVELFLLSEPPAGVHAFVSSYERETNTFERDIRGGEVRARHDVVTGLVRMSDKHKYRIDVVNISTEDVTISRAYLLIAR